MFDCLNNRWVQVFETNQNQRTANFDYSKKIRIKEPHGPGMWKKLESKNCQFQLFQKPQKPTRFHDRTNSFFGWICDFLTKTFENNNYISEWVFDF
jgi:hypothetical protein